MTTYVGYGVQNAEDELAAIHFERRSLRADDVAIDIAFCGVCHTDLHQCRNDWHNTIYPCIPGHEIIGHVTEVGSDVTAYNVGDCVAVGCMVDSCKACDRCNDDHEEQCKKFPTMTYNSKDRHSGEITYGGYSQHIVVRDQFVLRVPKNLNIQLAAPLLCAGITCWTPLKQWKVGEGTKVGIIGLGGLGHIGVKLAAALGAEVTMITTSPGKGEDARKLGAHQVLLSTDQQQMQTAMNQFDFILNTIPVAHDVSPYLKSLGSRGVMVIVGAAEPLPPVHAGLLMQNNRVLTGSGIGGIADTQEMLNFCAEHNILPECEIIDMQEVNDAFKRILANDVKYRFVVDMASLK